MSVERIVSDFNEWPKKGYFGPVQIGDFIEKPQYDERSPLVGKEGPDNNLTPRPVKPTESNIDPEVLKQLSKMSKMDFRFEADLGGISGIIRKKPDPFYYRKSI